MKRIVCAIMVVLFIYSNYSFGIGGDLGAGSGADGSETSPWLIEDFTDFQAFCGDSSYWASGVYTRLETDLDLNPALEGRDIYSRAPIAGNESSSIYSFSGTYYSGHFDGNGHIISNLTIQGASYLGLFGYTGSSTSISNLNIENVYITCSGYYTGGLASYNRGNIINCSSTGTVSGSYNSGGLAGYNRGSISNCCSTTSVSGSGTAGGLVGYNYYGTISSCFSGSMVSGSYYAGGLVGENYRGPVTNCYSSGTVNGYGYIGGLIGYFRNAEISKCYSIGAVTGNYNTGGLVGYNLSGIIIGSYWDVETSGQSSSFGGTAKTTVEMQNASTFVGWNDGSWTIYDGHSYPRLAWENVKGSPITTDYPAATYPGSGTGVDPYVLSTPADFISMGQRVPDWDGYYILSGDVDLSGLVYIPPVKFSGIFDGNGYVISNLSIDGDMAGTQYYLGLFGILYGRVDNLGLENVDVSGFNYVGGLAGRNYGTISGCYSSGDVLGQYYCGGLVGENMAGITNCYSVGSITGGYDVGGLTGGNGGTVSNCYSVCIVRGNEYFGGLAGESYGQVSDSYFYLYGGPDNSVGTMLNDQELQLKASFIGFDFVNDTNDGLDDFWTINSGYMPKLAWQVSPGFEPPYYLDSISTTLAGSGYSGDPYIIANLDDLLEFRNNADLRWGEYSLTADIDLAGQYLPEAFIPEAFMGSFSGNGHTISNMFISGDYNVGFFSNLYGSVDSLNFLEAMVDGSEQSGCVAGSNIGGKITNCNVSGMLFGGYCTGGICGKSYGPNHAGMGLISGCTSSVSITSDECYNVGGLVGHNGSIVRNCSSSGDIYGSYGEVTGGLIGKVGGYGSVDNCYSTVSLVMIGGSYEVGGLIGGNSGRVKRSYSTGKIIVSDGGSDIGGLVGRNHGCYDNENGPSEVSNCYSVSDLITSGDVESVGGFGGHCGGNIFDCYSAGKVSVLWYSENVGGFAGKLGCNGQIKNCFADNIIRHTGDFERIAGFCGSNMGGTLESCFWNTELSGLTEGYFEDPDANSPGVYHDVVGLTGAQMADMNLFTGYGWDFFGEIANGVFETWQMSAAAGMPVLSYFEGYYVELQGEGTQLDPYMVSNAFELGAVRNYPSDAWYVLVNDIDLAGISFSSALIPGFSGNFDGGYNTVSNLTISNGGDYCGFFGRMEAGSVVTGLKISHAKITAGHHAGVLAGQVGGGTIEYCSVSGEITARYYTGGLCGMAQGPNCGGSFINFCSSDVDVTGYEVDDDEWNCIIGGLVGHCGGQVSNCYSLGSVTSVSEYASIGGLIGSMGCNGSAANCYSVGHVSGNGEVGALAGEDYGEMNIYNCFWDIQASGTNIAVGTFDPDPDDQYYGLTTAEMQTMSVFTNVGWDFSETDGTPAVWQMPPLNYPKLAWQISESASDLNQDDAVDLKDFSFFAVHWLSSDCAGSSVCEAADINDSGQVDLADLQEFCSGWIE